MAKQPEVKPEEDNKGSITSQALATIPAGKKMPVALHGKSFKRKQVTRTVLSSVDGVELFFTITSPIVQAPEARKSRTGSDGKPAKEPPQLCEIINLETGELQYFITGTIFKSEMDEKYPDEAYVGKSFAVTSVLKKAANGNPLRLYEIDELTE